MQEYNFKIHHRPGHQHCKANALSLLPPLGVPPMWVHGRERTSYVSFAAATCQDIAGVGLVERAGEESNLKQVQVWPEQSQCHEQHETASESSVGNSHWHHLDGQHELWQLLVLRALREIVLGTMHSAVRARHFGVAKTLANLRHSFYWPD